MKKKTFMTMYWIGTLLFFVTLPSIKDVYLWEGIVLICLAGGLIIITLPKAVRKYKELTRVVKLYRDKVIDHKSRQEAFDNGLFSAVWDKFFDFLIFAVPLEVAIALISIGIGIICIKCF